MISKIPVGSEQNDEPTIQFRWSDSGPYSQPDILPLRFFSNEGFLPGQIHKVGSKTGKQSEAKCDVHVKRRVAELDYETHPEFNRERGMDLGVARITFADETRSIILSAEWKPKGRTVYQPSSALNLTGLSAEIASVAGRTFYRVMLGKKSVHAQECFDGGFVGTDFEITENLTGHLPEDWREFNKHYVPIFQSAHPDKSRVGAGLACGYLWTVSKGIKTGDVILSPDGTGRLRVGEVIGDYYYAPGEILFHRRPMRWTDVYIARDSMSDALRSSLHFSGTVCDLSRAGHGAELEKLVGTPATPAIVATDKTIEDPTVFALEKHLQEFLVHNWKCTELGKNYEIWSDEDSDGEQVKADDGYIDILAVSKDKKELLVVELKKGRASDVVVGQIQRYMGYVLDELAEENQTVRGVIVALEDDQRIRRAMRVTQNIEFFRYEVSFRLFKA